MAQVNTVLGPIHPKQLGTTSLHEHILGMVFGCLRHAE
jgi:predicted metal-dependent phosphotriesterase family hydrolase